MNYYTVGRRKECILGKSLLHLTGKCSSWVSLFWEPLIVLFYYFFSVCHISGTEFDGSLRLLGLGGCFCVSLDFSFGIL